jgi:phosphoglycerol transferase MdoB-like AlkP superfamily enzyme
VNHFTLAQKRTWLPSLIGLFLTITLISENYIPFSSFVKKSECWAYISQPNQIDLATNTAYNIFESLNREAETAPKAQITAFDYQKIHVNNNGEKKNVVILILESFARENIPSLNPEQKGYLTFLDSLMRESYYFPNAFANGRKSIDAIPAVWNSIPSAEVPFILSHSNAKSFHGLPATLKKQGYTNLFFHGAHNGSMAFDRYAQQNYIDRYFGMAEYPYPERDFDGTWGIWDEPFFNFAAQKLDSITDPFFATIFSLSSHNPCRVPAKYEQQFKEGSLPIHKSLQYSDFALKQFFEEAKTKNWFKNTLFVFTADHSIHPINDYYKTSEMAFAIPLFFYDPSLPNFKKRDTRTAQHLDIFPSVIHHLGITDSILSLGNNLFDPQSPQEVFNQISGTYQYTHKEHILHCSSSQVYNMFDRENDHYMTKDEALKKPTKAQQLLKRFRKKVDLLQRIKTSQNTQL